MERPVKVPPSSVCGFLGSRWFVLPPGGRTRARLGSLSTVIQSDIRGSAEAAAQSFIRPDLALTSFADQVYLPHSSQRVLSVVAVAKSRSFASASLPVVV